MNNKNIMETKYIIPDTQSATQYGDFAQQVSDLTYQYQNVMTPRPLAKIQTCFGKGHSVLLVNESSNELIAHAAIKWVSEKNLIAEIGTIVTKSEFIHQGFASMVTARVVEEAQAKYPQHQLFAFCNEQSLGLFHKLGWADSKRENLPDEVWDGCATCNNMLKARAAGKLCCDTVVILLNI